MKRLFTMLLLTIVVFTACKKDAKDTPPEITPTKPTHPNCKILRLTGEYSSITYFYNSQDLLTEGIDSNWYNTPTEVHVEVYTYDSLGRLSYVKTFNDRNKNEWVNLVTYSYHPGKIIKKTAVVQRGQVSESGRVYEYLLNDKGKLSGTTEAFYGYNNTDRLNYSEAEVDNNGNIILQKWFSDGRSLRIDSFTYDDKYNPALLMPEATILPTGLNNIKSVYIMDSTRKIFESITYPYTYNSTGYPLSTNNNIYHFTYDCK